MLSKLIDAIKIHQVLTDFTLHPRHAYTHTPTHLDHIVYGYIIHVLVNCETIYVLHSTYSFQIPWTLKRDTE